MADIDHRRIDVWPKAAMPGEISFELKRTSKADIAPSVLNPVCRLPRPPAPQLARQFATLLTTRSSATVRPITHPHWQEGVRNDAVDRFVNAMHFHSDPCRELRHRAVLRADRPAASADQCLQWHRRLLVRA